MRDGQPHIFGKVEDVDTDFLVDTGASVTDISETLFRRCYVRRLLSKSEHRVSE